MNFEVRKNNFYRGDIEIEKKGFSRMVETDERHSLAEK